MRIDVLGIGFDNVNMAQALLRCQELMEGGAAAYVVTPNAEIAYAAQSNPALLDALNSADLVLADGIGIVKAARTLRRPLPERVPGSETGPGLFPAMAVREKSLFLLGGKPGVAETAARRIRETYPALNVCGTHHGYFQDDEEVLPLIRAAKPDVIFVCFNAPRTELWMQKNKHNVGHALMLGLGGTIDILAGTVKRAPAIFRKTGFEWLYRLLSQPSRIRRQLALPRFLAAVRKQKQYERKQA